MDRTGQCAREENSRTAKKKLTPDLCFDEIAKINFEIDALTKEIRSVEHPLNND